MKRKGQIGVDKGQPEGVQSRRCSSQLLEEQFGEGTSGKVEGCHVEPELGMERMAGVIDEGGGSAMALEVRQLRAAAG